MALLAYKNSVSSCDRVKERSRAKSSAANINPLRSGEAAHIDGRSMTALADSMRAMRRKGRAPGPLEYLFGAACRRTSVTKDKSAALLTFGITIVSRLGEVARAV